MSSFPAMDAAVREVMGFLQSKTVGAANTMRLVGALRGRMVRALHDRELSDDNEAAFARLLSRAREIEGYDSNGSEAQKEYKFDRKFLFRMLVLGNLQLAQLTGIRGPSTQTNAACAGTTQVRHDMHDACEAEPWCIFARCKWFVCLRAYLS